MSTNDVINIKSAYEKMLEDGSANRKVDMSMVVEPDVGTAEGLGDKVNETAQPRQPEQEQDNHTDYTEHDSHIQGRIDSLRTKMNGVKSKKVRNNEAREIASLKKRVEKLEEALMLVMETHEKLL